MPTKLSAAIIALNEEKKLPDCLKSVAFVDEIIVIDSGSTDGTRQVAEDLGARVFDRKFDNFSAQKNAAIEKTTGDWILLIDADERVTPELEAAIVQAVNKSDGIAAYHLTRINRIFGGLLRHGASGLDQPVRLIRRGCAQYEGLVHEQLAVNGATGFLEGELHHITYQTLDDYYKKFNLFSTLDAQEMLRRKGKKPSFVLMMLRPGFEFVFYYFLKLGFLDGWRGFLYQVLSSYYVFIKYAKAREIFENDQN